MQLSMVFLLLVSASMMASCCGELDVSFAKRLQQIKRTLDEAGMDGIEETDAEVDEFMLTARRVLRQPANAVRPVNGDTPAYGAPAAFVLGAYGSMAYGSMAYGSMAFGSMAYGSMAYGSMAYGSMAYGSMAYGSMAYGSMAYGSMAYGSMAYGSMAYGSAAYGSAAYGSASSIGTWVDGVLDKAGDGLGNAGDALKDLGSSAPGAVAASATMVVLAAAGAALLGALLV